MKTRILVKIINDKRCANMLLEYPTEEKAVASFRQCFPHLRTNGVFTAAQMEFNLDVDGIPIQRSDEFKPVDVGGGQRIVKL